jgi:RNA polymerase sigma factor (sigma-70 family)
MEPLTPEQQQLFAERVREGDPAAEDALARQFAGRVGLMLRARIRDRETARDLAQEVLMAVITALREGRVRETSRLGAFVHGTARNVLNSYYRSRQQAPPTVELEAGHLAEDPVAALEAASRQRLVRRALEELEPLDRGILLLTLVEGLKSGEVAARLGLGLERVRQRKSRAVRRLAERMSRV